MLTRKSRAGSGNEAQAKFVQMLIDKGGQFSSNGSGCSDVGACDPEGVDAVVAAARSRAATKQSDSTVGDGGISSSKWMPGADSALVRAVAAHGGSAWDAVAIELEQAGHNVAASAAAARWAVLAPGVREELKDPQQQRECGHSCATCPTRTTCQLHTAVEQDIEDTVAQRFAQT